MFNVVGEYFRLPEFIRFADDNDATFRHHWKRRGMRNDITRICFCSVHHIKIEAALIRCERGIQNRICSLLGQKLLFAV